MKLHVGTVVLALATAGVAATAARPAASTCAGSQTQQSKSYLFALGIGPEEPMYTPAQARRKHLKHGEVMVAGRMAPGMKMGPGMTMAEQTRHLEVYICSRASGKALGSPQPTIAVTDLTVHAKPHVIPIAVMYDMAAGRSGIHFGNNVALVPGHRLRVDVVETAQHARFTATVPR